MQELTGLGFDLANILNFNHATEFVIAPNLGIIEVIGAKRGDFLQGQLTNNMDKLDTEVLLSAHCDLKGKVETLTYVIKEEEGLYLIVDNECTDFFIKELNKYAKLSQVELKNRTEELQVVVSNDYDLVKKVQAPINFGMTVGEKEDALAIFDSHEHSFSPQFFSYLELANHIARIHNDNRGKYLAFDISLEKINAIDFSKGCYRGQEIIARVNYRGNLKRSLFTITYHPQPGKIHEKIFSFDNMSKPIGEIIRPLKLADGSVIALAIIELAQKDKHLMLDSDTVATIQED